MEPLRIKDVLLRYKRLLRAPQGFVMDAFSKAVDRVVGVRIEARHVGYTVRTRTIFLRAPSPLKSRILMKQEEILLELKKELGEKDCPISIV